MRHALQWIALATIVGGCADFRRPGDLRYAQILAVRSEPPAVLADQRARIDLLVTGDDGAPTVRPPDSVAPAQPQPGSPAPPPMAAQLITQQDGLWYVSAPSADVLAQLRQSLGLPADSTAPLPFTVAASLTIDGQVRLAEKVVWLGASAANPTITAVTIDGRPLEDQMVVGAAGDHALGGTATGAGTLSFAWYSGFGELKGYRQTGATLQKAKPGDTGAVVLVVRDDRGGVNWRMNTLHMQ
jgi:hypothetical protein